MSIAGIRSNRGDGYQTLVAFDLALSVLSSPDYLWMEVDSVTWLVDDVVVGKVDGTKICCQCKKNQIDSKAWTIADLADELDKASNVLSSDPKTEVRFYSRSPFGALAKLREHSTAYADDVSYQASLGKEHRTTDVELSKRLVNTSILSTYQFLRRTTFEISPELDRMGELLQERLRFMASNPMVAYDTLWRHLDQLGARMEGDSGITSSIQHRLTKNDLKNILLQAGAMLVPTMNLAEVRASFVSTSAIGRSWHRDIGGLRISNPVIHELLAAIDAKKRAVLLTGLPGSGKTCVMLELQEILEKNAQTRSDLVPLFIQSREFADLATAQDRQAQGLAEQWVEKVARMAEDVQVVVVIDSLDVLSIAREHSVLTYFLAQIDRLLLIPNVTVVTACRDFDRQFDRRISERKWDHELMCSPLNWESEISPLLETLGIEITTIDEVTRDLIANPRELSLFVELAQRQGTFNVVTSHALAQRYLDIIVRGDPALGEVAIQAIETIADQMLKTRSLAVPRQRFAATSEIQRALLSHNVLHETQDGKFTFGHQTLLDVLVISGAVRRGITLSAFIQGLPPVPFVRPSIRSFVVQLAIGERREFRKQLRAVLTGNTAFHIRRLVAESFAEQKPQDDDWLLIRDLRANHREVFQVIYYHAGEIDWHHFWIKFLVPSLRDTKDADGLTAHLHRVSQWKNEDVSGVLKFWEEVLALDWIDGNQIARQLGSYLSEIDVMNSALLVPLLNTLLNMPRQEHSFLSRAVARCVAAGGLDDFSLWRYIAGDISNDDVLAFRFDGKLHCEAHEFGNSNDKFLQHRMQQSSALLDLAIQSVEQWSRTRISLKGSWMAGSTGFMSNSSYDDTHSQNDLRHVDSERILMDAMEAAIRCHAKTNSQWWQENCRRLCFSHEGVLRYFAIRACTAFPEINIAVIASMLCDKDLLGSDLAYELGTLIQVAFICLAAPEQDAVMSAILSVGDGPDSDDVHQLWILRERANLIITIPCHLRSCEAQAVLDTYEKAEGALIRQPSIGGRGGMIGAPFPFEVFFDTGNDGVLRLLAHYTGYSDMHGFDFLTGGEREVGSQLREAASRHPTRFLHLLHAHWANISTDFRDNIMEGVSNHLAHRYGNLQPNGTWAPLEEPDAPTLAKQILDELERHTLHWRHNRAASNALQACAHVIQNTQEAARLVFLALDFASLREESSIRGDSVNLMTIGINMMRGHVVDALMILANKLQEKNIDYPELLSPTLLRFSQDEHPAIRVLILRRLPYLQSKNPELGWEIFDLATQENTEGIWDAAERCMYYAYHDDFQKISSPLARLYDYGRGEDLETWGRISALAALANRIVFTDWLETLKTLNSTDAWRGATSVWTHSENIKQHREQCFAGIAGGLSANNPHSIVVAQNTSRIFNATTPQILIPADLIERFFSVLEGDTEKKTYDLFGVADWLNATSYSDPELALVATEIYLAYVRRTKPYLFDHENNLTQLLIRLFAGAEEIEESDHGAMLRRVVAVQDELLAIGVSSINDWLKKAERP